MDMTKDIIDFTQKLQTSMPELETEYSNEELQATEFKENSQAEATSPKAATAPSASSPIPTATILPTATTETSEERTEKPSLLDMAASPNLQTKEAGSAVGAFTNTFTATGDLTPPPRPLTSSEVVGMGTSLDDPDLQIDLPPKKSHSLPSSPNHLLSSSVLPTAPAALFEFGGRHRSTTSKIVAATNLLGPGAAKTKPSAAISAAANQQFCLRWNNYQSNLTNVFDELLQNESFVDVTLACEGQSIKAHKMVLSACSPYFQALFYDNPCQHPIIIMRDVRWQELKAIMEFMYKGEINVSQDQINPLLKVAEMLKIRGLAEVNSGAGAGVAAHPMVPQQRMTVFDEPDPDEPDDEEDDIGYSLAKRARLMREIEEQEKFKLSAHQRARKRSRDGLLIEENLERLVASRRSRSNTPLPSIHTGSIVRNTMHHTIVDDEDITDNTDAMSPPPPIPPPVVSMTAQTIVRNPFASPNPTATPNTSTSGNNSSTTHNNSTIIATTSSSAASSAAAHRPSTAVSSSSSPPPPSAHSASSINGPLASPAGNNSGGASSTTSSSHHQLQSHHHPVHSAALVNSHHSHHSHHGSTLAAQQLAAQHQLHAAAHSHAAMASALGASLAAAAAGAGGSGGNGGGGGSGASGAGATHHDDMEIKPEIAEMIREEERVSHTARRLEIYFPNFKIDFAEFIGLS